MFHFVIVHSPFSPSIVVVFHHGKNATGGHYTTNVFHPGINSWVKIDDSRIQTVSVQDVLKFSSPRMPYLLYYRRVDLA